MRTEGEIRAVLKRTSQAKERGLQVVVGAVEVPLNNFTIDLLHWVLGEPSDFGVALDFLVAREQAKRN